MKRGKFSDEEINFLINNYHTYTTEELCEILDRNTDSIRYKASKLNLQKHNDIYYFNKMKNMLEDNDYTLLSSKYIGAKELYEVKCNEHNIISFTTYDSIMQNKLPCEKCKSNKIGSALKVDIGIVRNEFYNKNLIPLFNDLDYLNNKALLSYKCKIHDSEIQFISYDSLRRSKFGCQLCAIEHRSELCKGENSPLWKGGLRSENDKLRDTREYKLWRNAIYKKDKYICQCCGAKNGNGYVVKLRAHHKENFADNPYLRFDISNGITLCSNCHDANVVGGFHNLYGTHYNNTEQLEEYIQNYQLNNKKAM